MPKQDELPGMPADTPLGKVAKKFVSKKEDLAEVKLAMIDLEKEILQEMKAAKQKHFKISAAGENYEFHQTESKDHVRCVKITKRPKKPGFEAAEAS